MIALGRRLEHGCQLQLLGKAHGFLKVNLTCGWPKVCLVTYQHDISGDFRRRIGYKSLYLQFQIDERLSIRNVIDRDATVWIPVVGLWYRLEALLASRVPYLELNGAEPVNEEALDFEVDANGAKIILIKCVISEPKQHWGLTRAGPANKHYFKHGVEIILGGEPASGLLHSVPDLFGLLFCLDQRVLSIELYWLCEFLGMSQPLKSLWWFHLYY